MACYFTHECLRQSRISYAMTGCIFISVRVYSRESWDCSLEHYRRLRDRTRYINQVLTNNCRHGLHHRTSEAIEFTHTHTPTCRTPVIATHRIFLSGCSQSILCCERHTEITILHSVRCCLVAGHYCSCQGRSMHAQSWKCPEACWHGLTITWRTRTQTHLHL
jgi:hypothetical protein